MNYFYYVFVTAMNGANTVTEILNLKSFNMKYLKDLMYSRNGYYDQQTLVNIKKARDLHDTFNQKLNMLGYTGEEKKDFFTTSKVPYVVPEAPIENFEFLTTVSDSVTDCLLNEDAPVSILSNKTPELIPVDITNYFDDALVGEPTFDVTEKEPENLLFFRRLKESKDNKQSQDDVYNRDYDN